MRPKRREGITVVQNCENRNEGILAMDLAKSRANFLLPDAARVWRACIGKLNVEEISLVTNIPLTVVRKSLEQLKNANLLV